MKTVVGLAAAGEVALGVALLIVPSIVVRLLLGESLPGLAVPVARVLGLALIGLGVACWPGPASLGLLIYSAAVAVYLASIGVAGVAHGVLLWPAVVLHLVLAVLLIRAWRADRKPRKAQPRASAPRANADVTDLPPRGSEVRL